MMIDDWELLQRWATRRDEIAFGELVSRHVGIRVYSVGPNRYDDGGIKGTLKDDRQADDIVIGVEVEAENQ
ncbi:MAG: hypothetical protein FWD61_19620 [Phycisphaerales bacterium]|nr:hypothetical protein [Phycisphaerales bacterium]